MKEANIIACLEENRSLIQDLLNKGWGLGNICRHLKVRYPEFARWIEAEHMVPWPELSDMERVTFVNFVRGNIEWNGEPRVVTKQADTPKVILDAEEYVRLLCLATAYENMKE